MTDLILEVQKFAFTEGKTVSEVIRSLDDKYYHYVSLITEDGLYATDNYYLKQATPEIRQMWLDSRIINDLVEEVEELVKWMDLCESEMLLSKCFETC